MFFVLKTNKGKQLAEVLDSSDTVKDIVSYDFLHKLSLNIVGVTDTDIVRCKLSEVQQMICSERTLLNGGVKFSIANRCLSKAVLADNTTNVVIPVGVSTINMNVFACQKQLSAVTFSNDLRKIGAGAFEETGIEHLVLPEGLEEIGDRAFFYCKELKSVSFPSTLKRIGASAFANCSQLTTIELPEGIEVVDKLAFSKTAITEVHIPDSLQLLGEGAFLACNLTNLVTYKNIVYCDDYAISVVKDNNRWGIYGWGPNWDKLEFKPNIRGFSACLFLHCPVKRVSIPDTVRVLPADLFAYSRLEEIVLPNNLCAIGDFCFKNTKLRHIEIPDSVTAIGKAAFLGCRNLSALKLSANLKVLRNRLLQSCVKLKHISVPEGVEHIESAAFTNCKSLTQLDLPTTLRRIDSDFIYQCHSLTRVEIPEGVEELRLATIQECNSLEEIVLPSTIKKFGQLVASECPELRSIIIKADDFIIGDWYEAKGKDLLYLFSGSCYVPTVYIPRNATYKDKLYYSNARLYTFNVEFKDKLLKLAPKFL